MGTLLTITLPILIVVLVGGLAAGMAWGGRLPELDREDRRDEERGGDAG